MFDPPSGSKKISYKDDTFYYNEGEFYKPKFSYDTVTYIKARPPDGLVVDSLPDGAEEFELRGKTFYRYKRIHYEVITEGSEVKYKVMTRPPTSSQTETPAPEKVIMESEE